MKSSCLQQKQPNGWLAGTIPLLLIWCNGKVPIISWTSCLLFGQCQLILGVGLPVLWLRFVPYSCLSILIQGLSSVYSGKAFYPLLFFFSILTILRRHKQIKCQCSANQFSSLLTGKINNYGNLSCAGKIYKNRGEVCLVQSNLHAQMHVQMRAQSHPCRLATV